MELGVSEHLKIVKLVSNKPRAGNYSPKYEFMCSCGQSFVALISRVVSGKIKHCGCMSKANKIAANQRNGIAKQTSDDEILGLVTRRGLEWLDEPVNGKRYSYKNRIRVKCPRGHIFKTTKVYLANGANGCRVCVGLESCH